MPLTTGNLPTNFCWNNQNRFGKMCKNVISDSKNGCHFPRSKSFEVKFAKKVPFTPINVPTMFGWNNQNRLGEKCKNVISLKTLKMAAISQGRGRLMSYFWKRCPLSLAMNPPSFDGIPRIDLEKCAKM